jgi:hypothetical protein
MSVRPVDAASGSCNLNAQGLIGVDSGVAIQTGCEYDLTVVRGTPVDQISSTLLPALEKDLVKKMAPLMIARCAPTTADLSTYADVTAIGTAPADQILDGRTCLVPSDDCYRILFVVTVYVRNTSFDVEAMGWFALLAIIKQGGFTSLDPAIVSVAIGKGSWITPEGGTQIFRKKRMGLLESLLASKNPNWINSNIILFSCLVATASLMLIIIVVFLVWRKYNPDKGGEFSKETPCYGCKKCCGQFRDFMLCEGCCNNDGCWSKCMRCEGCCNGDCTAKCKGKVKECWRKCWGDCCGGCCQKCCD